MLDVTDIEYWLALVHAPTIGAVRFKQLLARFGSPKQVFEAGIDVWKTLGFKAELLTYLQQPAWAEVEKELQWLKQPNNFILTLASDDYPLLLKQIHDPPPVLFVCGDYTLLKQRQVAIVGTRNATQEGMNTARKIAGDLANFGIVITSGMAIGIDGAAHEGALSCKGKTIAVAGTGLDRVYPAQHRELAHRIAEQGALVSELTLNSSFLQQRGNFPRRNRIISGLSLGTLVVEAGLRSGSLITAQQASEQDREVFAIPGSIYNVSAKGCHLLIKQGAKLIETAQDVMEELLINIPFLDKKTIEEETFINYPIAILSKEPEEDLGEDYMKLLKYINEIPTSVDNLVELSQLTVREISSMLLILELRGLIISQPGGLYARS